MTNARVMVPLIVGASLVLRRFRLLFLDYRLRSWRRSSSAPLKQVPDIHVRCVTLGRSIYSGVPCVCLIVEDEKKVAKALRDGARGAEHYEVRIAVSGEEGFFLVNHESFDLVILDLMLPRARRPRGSHDAPQAGPSRRPCLILTAKDTVDDRVHGLDSGADDYLVKPFAFPELLARIRALLAARPPGSGPGLQQDDLTMDLVTRKVMRAGRALDAHGEGIRDARVPASAMSVTLCREKMLARDVWRVTARATPLDNVIDVTVDPVAPEDRRPIRDEAASHGARRGFRPAQRA